MRVIMRGFLVTKNQRLDRLSPVWDQEVQHAWRDEMRIAVVALAMVAGLAGCAGSGTGNSAGISYTMSGNLSRMATVKDANRHCQKYGKVALLSSETRLTATFQCVEGTM
jgi:hypothetical protein